MQEKEKVQLSAEEARRAADELVRKAKEKREVGHGVTACMRSLQARMSAACAVRL
jgi:polyhydroxyalkanoate synthesis regulator phasin